MLHIKVNPEQGKALDVLEPSQEDASVEPSSSDSTIQIDVEEETEG